MTESFKARQRNVKRNGNSLNMVLDIKTAPSDELGWQFVEVFSDRLFITGSVAFDVMVEPSMDSVRDNPCLHLSVKLAKTEESDELTYTMNYIQEVQYSDEGISFNNITSEDKSWKCVSTKAIEFQYENIITYLISVEVSIVPPVSACVFLHDDTELTDFELQGQDGSIRLHKLIAAASSPVLKGMFAGEWRETVAGVVNLPDVSRATLQHLKDYMYLGQVPDTGLVELLLLSKYYLMPGLQTRCIYKLLAGATAQTIHELMELATTQDLPQLLTEIVTRLEKGALVVADDLRKMLVEGKKL